jgi:hypothetical protein
VDIIAAQGEPMLLTRPVENGKIFNQKSFKYFVGHLWVEENIDKFYLQVLFMVSAVLILFPLFATSVVDTVSLALAAVGDKICCQCRISP